jgi:phytoene/squalene synthetase
MADLDRQLIRTSRTFALAIPELPEPTRREVEVAYLLFRVADTFEDATLWPVERQADALQTFENLLDPETAAPYLMKRARWFGEGLQLTNIVKDAADDEGEGRSFLPKEGRREDVFNLAREDLHLAGQYVTRLEQARAPRGVVAFSAVPVLLAWGTLERVEAQGPGAKLTRDEVSEIVAGVHRALDAGEPVLSGRDPDAPQA